ncbi:alpha/beta fold hydrolase [Nocardioides sp. CFH 31398]|uniref:alpha/beta fold hydrolase n=1 Tax=Nocardioides sp. CFH 31398 TaxID=2919579 RepID=UPI001F063ECA|nr:alpha/beta hydrolase [Nocardioides sp. CFH 31398]MCH1865768.1 alpha/beta hydrolase [Nocardioides sp. CFH 31398]
MLAHRDTGGGVGGPDGAPVLLLLHAFPLSSRTWRRLVPLLEPWARVVTLDLPGLGASAVPDADPSMAYVADAVVEVLDARGVERCVPFGVSTGGYAALELAARHPHRLAGLVLGSTTPERVAPDVPEERRAVADEVEARRSTGPVADSAQEGLGPTARREQPELEAELAALIAATDPDGVAWMARAIAAREDRTAVLASYDGPVQLVFGAEDEATPPSWGERMRDVRRAAGRDARLDVLPATGHLTALERPAEVARLLATAQAG